MSNKNVVLLFKGVKQHSFSAKADCLVTLNPGSNVVSLSKFNILTGNAGDEDQDKCKSISFCDMLESGDISLLDEKAVDVAETSEEENTTGTHDPNKDKIKISIVELGAKDAIALANAESDIDKVKGYLEAEEAASEPRKTVVAACNIGIELLQKAIDDAAAD